MLARHASSRPSLPLRFRPSLAVIRPRPFTVSGCLGDDVDATSHYEILNVRPDASPAEIKKSFYRLSKTYHPDHNPSDPHAARRFTRISEAYSVLGKPEKRAAYDRDVLRRQPYAASHGSRPRGSYHSTGPAGGRPASGLSRRRGTFQGPPPSFFRSGGWGAHSAKRQAAHDDSTGGGWTSRMGGMGPGQDPYGHRDKVPHFDHDAHERTQRRGDERRARRMEGRGYGGDDSGYGLTANFAVIMGILVLAIVFPVSVWGVVGGLRGPGPTRERPVKKAKDT